MKPLQRLVAVIFILIFLMLAVIVLYAQVPAFAGVLNAGVARLTDEPDGENDEDGTELETVLAETETAEAAPDTALIYTPDDGAYSGSEADTPYDEDETMEAETISGTYAPAEASYTAPSEETLDIPEELAARTGLEPIDADNKTVSDEEADRIEAVLDTEPAGDGLDFDALIYPYYSMLGDEEKHLYRQIYAHADALIDDFASVEPEASEGQIKNAFTAVFCDHPELFWLNTAYSATFRENGRIVEFELYFNKSASDIYAAKKTFAEAADDILKKADSAAGAYDKELAVHDAIAEKDLYNLAAPMNQSAYSSVVNSQTVCAGYSRAFQYLMGELGIPCYYCFGYAGENHAWNIVKLDDDYYNVDVTWDDTDDSRGAVHTWFNRTDDDYAATHVRRDLAVKLPPCRGTAYLGPEDEETPAEPAPEAVPDNTARQTEEAAAAEDTPSSEAPSSDTASRASSNEISDWSGVITDLASYYEACYDSIMERGTGSYSFDLTVSDERLIRQISNAYSKNYTRSGFMQKAMADSDAVHCHVRATVTAQDDGTFLVKHSVNMY